MIPSDVLAEIATLGLSREQAERVASMLARVEKATEARSNEAIDARRANDRERKARQRHGQSREVTGQNGTEPPSSPPPKNTNQTPSTPSPETTKRAKRRTAMVQDAQPTKADVQAAIADGLSMDEVRSEWRAFRDFHTSKGNVMADWSAAWRTWLRNRKRFGKPKAAGPRPGRQTIQDRFANLIQDEPEDHEPACYEGHTVDGSLSTDGDDPRGRYALAGSAEPFGADPGWPLASAGYAARNG